MCRCRARRTRRGPRAPQACGRRPRRRSATPSPRTLTAIDLPAMRVGVGLPTTTPGADGALLVEWARKADAGPFSSLGVLDRLLYDSFDPFSSLAAAAAVTERIRVATMIAIGPLRPAAALVKNAASVQALCGGRLTLGLAVGAREDDYEAAGVPHKGRGARLSDQLGALRDWDAAAVVPASVRDTPPELLVGGLSGAA